MAFDLVLDIGNSRIKGGLFEGKTLTKSFGFPIAQADQILSLLQGHSIARVLISSVHAPTEEKVKALLSEKNIPFHLLDYKKLKMGFDVEEPEQLGQDRIAGAYGALTLFPIYDCVVVDCGTAITVDLIAKEGRYLGGMIYPGGVLCAKALSNYTDKLPLVTPQKPSSPLAKTTVTHLQSGIYYGQLGAIERMIAELCLSAPSPSSVKVIATGGGTEGNIDLEELVDKVEPHLVLLGLHEILQEIRNLP